MPKHEPDSNVNKEQQALKAYIAECQADIVVQRQKVMAEKGYKDFYQFEEGTTEFVLEPKIPRQKDGDFGRQSIFRISVDGREYDWGCNHKSPVYRQIMGDGIKDQGFLSIAPVKIKMLSLGEGQKRRQKLKKA